MFNALSSSSRILPICLAVLAMILSGCKSPEERAVAHFQSAKSLAAAGDLVRAQVELRNVFELNGFHKEARVMYAEIALETGDTKQAYGNYLRLVEQYPNTIEARFVLAEMAVAAQNWAELNRHGSAAIELAPNHPRSTALRIMINYRDALEGRNAEESAAVVRKAKEALASDPGLVVAHHVVMDSALRSGRPEEALPHASYLLERNPLDKDLRVLRLGLLHNLGDSAETEAELEAFYGLFPKDQQVSDMLLSWHLAEGNLARVEALLRTRASEINAGPSGHMAVVSFLESSYGKEAAREELARLISVHGEKELARYYRAVMATLNYADPYRDPNQALSDLQTVLADAPATDLMSEARMMLARVLIDSENSDEARSVVEEILTQDPGSVAALRTRARWRLDEQKPQEAILDLRYALNQSPRDTEVLTLMAEAQLALGNEALAQQRLALAMEYSDGATRETLTYARYLVTRDRLVVAKKILSEAFDRQNSNLSIATLLGEVLVQKKDYRELNMLVEKLNQMNSPEANALSQQIVARAPFSLVTKRNDEKALQMVLQVLSIQLENGRLAEARRYIDILREDDPHHPILMLYDADLAGLEQRFSAAIPLYQGILEQEPKADQVVQKLYVSHVNLGQMAMADQVLANGLREMPTSVPLRILQAAQFEQNGALTDAIGLYDRLLSEFPQDQILMNNIAALLAETDDEADLLRAQELVDELANSPLPEIWDTIGWVHVKSGNIAHGIEKLEAAALQMPENGLVQMHLGLAYLKADRSLEARKKLTIAIELLDNRHKEERQLMREKLDKLNS